MRAAKDFELSSCCMLETRCGLHPTSRFTFYDQVHTTGMDIPQAIHARAAQTLGKDMTFRDYAQGAYRMRGVGNGQQVPQITGAAHLH